MQGEMSYKQTKYQKLIEEFSDSGWNICQVTFDKNNYKLASDLSGRLTQAARRYGKHHIRSITHKDRVYLINKLKG